MESTGELEFPTATPGLMSALAGALTSIPAGAPGAATGLIHLFNDGQVIYEENDGKRRMRKPISLASLRAAVVGEAIDSGWLEPGTVRWGAGVKGDFVVQFIAPAIHDLPLILPGNQQHETLHVPLPGLVFAGMGRSYWVWSIKEQEFSPKAQLFGAPIPNILTDGRVCWGSNKVPECSTRTMASAWRLFQEAPFNQNAAADRSISEPKDVRKALMAVAAAGATSYPLEDLVPWKLSGQKAVTVDRMINSILGED